MKIGLRLLGIVVVAAALMAMPVSPDSVPTTEVPAGTGFVWAQDSVWMSLERAFVRARDRDCREMEEDARDRIRELTELTAVVARTEVPASDPALDSLEVGIFSVGPIVAACPDLTEPFLELYREMRKATKIRSVTWDMRSPYVRDRLYRLLYGGRAAVEEVVLQHPDRIASLVEGWAEPSATPAAAIEGVRVHSGDILVSRGGYPTSALISRGSDYPGNFSHVALLHVDGATGEVSAIESHIEFGMAVATSEQYLEDKKLRILVLRPRSDLPQLQDDPMLPHAAAEAALARARSGHVPYDFEMDYTDPSRVFCSEVASSVYSARGIDLWMGISRISNPGLRRWLAAFGVRHFETQEPSDLEYDPQLVVVAEWREVGTLFRDHVDNAVTDAMLEGAERGDELDYRWYELPPTRLLKAYSWMRERFGGVGPIPQGMSVAAALRNRSFTERHRRLSAAVHGRAAEFERTQGYVAPYWRLLGMARAATASERGG